MTDAEQFRTMSPMQRAQLAGRRRLVNSGSALDEFTPLTPVMKPAFLFGREEELSQLSTIARERGRHALVFGEVGVGKTSLGLCLHAMLDGERRVARVCVTASDDFDGLWRRIVPLLRGDGLLKADAPLTPDAVAAALSGLPNDVVPLIIIDDFHRANGTLRAQLAETMRAQSDSGGWATILLFGTAVQASELCELTSELRRRVQQIGVARLPADAIARMVKAHCDRLGLTFGPALLSRVQGASRGFPEFAHWLTREAARCALDRKATAIGEADLTLALKATTAAYEDEFGANFERAIQSPQRRNRYEMVLNACATTTCDDEDYFTLVAVLPTISSLARRPLKLAHFYNHVEAFCTPERGQILEKTGSARAYRYRFSDPRMQAYVMMRALLNESTRAQKPPARA